MSTAMDAKIMSKFSQYDEEIKTNCINDENVYAVKDKMKKYVPSLEEQDLDNFVVVKSRLLYVGTDDTEREIANRLGLGGGDNSDSKATITEIQEIIDGVVDLKDKFPDSNESENNDTEKGFIGTKLLDRQNHLFDGTWNILIDYKNNKETGRYENGYWLEKGKTYIIDGKSLTFKNDYVVDYENKEFNVLSSERVNWNKGATLGVQDNIALDLDPMSFANGTWEKSEEEDEVNHENFENFKVKGKNEEKIDTGIQKVGDVEYDDEKKSLKFNRNKDNSDATGGYVKLCGENLGFEEGFTFEFYGSLERGPYPINVGNNKNEAVGLFSRTTGLSADMDHWMRFLLNSNGAIADFCNSHLKNQYEGEGVNFKYGGYGGDIYFINPEDINKFLGDEIYFTCVYNVFKENCEDDENYDEFMKSDKVDRIDFYFDGVRYGYTYHDSNAFKEGLEKWNNDESDFFIGMTAVGNTSSLYYLKGNLYSIRLYESPLNQDEVKLNYDMTLKYRSSFLND